MARKYFGTDGVRGVVGEFLTPELVERIGRAAALWTGAASVFVGRDTRASGVELEEAFARGVISAGCDCVLGGVLPTPAVALMALDLGVVISASHNPPEYNGVKFFDSQGRKLSDESEEQIEELLAAAPGTDIGTISHVEVATDSYLQHVLDRFGADLSGLRLVVDCANGAYAGLAPDAFRRCGAEVVAIADEPDGTNINVGCGATDTAWLRRTVAEGGFDLGIAFDGDGDRMLAVDEQGQLVDGDQIVAILALDQGVDTVAVTVMANLGFHALMREHGIRVVTTDVGDRYVLEALHREGAVLGGEESGHIVFLRDHVTGDGLAAGLLLCAALRGRKLSELAGVMPRYPQVKENVRVAVRELTPAIVAEVERRNREWDGDGRILVRPSGTEPVIRVLAEASDEAVAAEACASIATLVRRELG
ncbi:MAG TPA: phosphoglucosamine mutase [Gaiellaceae bacterium]|jgi:phosphoglucosamine mutase|nr:phosphoglucosamine mutase [Gaiellaceae bacterium]